MPAPALQSRRLGCYIAAASLSLLSSLSCPPPGYVFSPPALRQHIPATTSSDSLTRVLHLALQASCRGTVGDSKRKILTTVEYCSFWTINCKLSVKEMCHKKEKKMYSSRTECIFLKPKEQEQTFHPERQIIIIRIDCRTTG